MRARTSFAVLTLAGVLVAMAPDAAVGQEVGSDVQMPAAMELVSSASLGLVGGPATAAAATPQAFVTAVQVIVVQALVDPRGETQARRQLGDFRTSILIKAGVLTFDAPQEGSRAQEGSPAQDGKVEVREGSERPPRRRD